MRAPYSHLARILVVTPSISENTVRHCAICYARCPVRLGVWAVIALALSASSTLAQWGKSGSEASSPARTRPAEKVPFPPIRDWRTLQITLERSASYFGSPTYRVEIHGDGTVIYEGSCLVFVAGRRTSQISFEAVREIYDVFQKADYFWLYDSYRDLITDQPTYTKSIAYDDHTKSVRDYAGRDIGMPAVVTEVEDEVDRIAGTERWLKGSIDPSALSVCPYPCRPPCPPVPG